MSFNQEKSRLGTDFRNNVNNYEGEVKGAADSNAARDARVARIRNATNGAKQRMAESEARAIQKIYELPSDQGEQLTELWEEAAETLTSLMSDVLQNVVQMIVNLVANIVRTVVNIFDGARRILRRLFG